MQLNKQPFVAVQGTCQGMFLQAGNKALRDALSCWLLL